MIHQLILCLTIHRLIGVRFVDYQNRLVEQLLHVHVALELVQLEGLGENDFGANVVLLRFQVVLCVDKKTKSN